MGLRLELVTGPVQVDLAAAEGQGSAPRAERHRLRAQDPGIDPTVASMSATVSTRWSRRSIRTEPIVGGRRDHAPGGAEPASPARLVGRLADAHRPLVLPHGEHLPGPGLQAPGGDLGVPGLTGQLR